MKKCNDCNEQYPTTTEYFYKNKSSRDGLNPYCKECTKKRSRKWAVSNQEQFKETRAEWYQDNKDRLLEKQKLLDEKNKEQKEIYYRSYQKSAHGKDKFKQYGINRKSKNHNISIDEWSSCKEYFNNECAYCGLNIENHKKRYAGVLKQIDFNREHVDDEGANDLSNCVPSCHSCNSKKRTQDFDHWYNDDNQNYTKERYGKIVKWLENDYKLYIETK
jgi:HNH endonuclease